MSVALVEPQCINAQQVLLHADAEYETEHDVSLQLAVSLLRPVGEHRNEGTGARVQFDP